VHCTTVKYIINIAKNLLLIIKNSPGLFFVTVHACCLQTSPDENEVSLISLLYQIFKDKK